MPFCQHCGQEIEATQEVCLSCGRAVKSTSSTTHVHRSSVNDEGGFGWGLLGFCIPIVGLVLYLVWMNDRPNTAKAAGMGALISVGVSILFYIIAAAAGLLTGM
jgi:hypothetical protein